MSLTVWLTYVAAVLLMMSTPGPSQLLMMANSMSNGLRRATLTAAGDLSANILQMLAAGFGLGVLIAASEHAFTAIKWAGVAYLVWMGVAKIRSAGRGTFSSAAVMTNRKLYLQGFVTSAANPKAVVFFAALFPQFIDAGAPFWPQFLILSVTYLLIDACFLAIYGGGADWVARKLKKSMQIWMDRATGGLLIVAAILLGLKSTVAR